MLQQNSSLAALTLQPSPLWGLQAATPRQQELEEHAWHLGGETATAEKQAALHRAVRPEPGVSL